MLTLADDAQLVAKKVRLFAELAKLVLDTEAKLDGVLVKLNCTDEPTASADGSPPPETKPFKLKLSDAEYGVWAGKRYQLHVDGVKLEGTTDAEGLVDKRIPKAAISAALVVWLGDYPTGPTRARMIRLAPLAAVTSPRGAAERLTHLGYFQGEPKDKVDDGLREALEDFQEHVGLPVSGELDAATVTRLDALHGA